MKKINKIVIKRLIDTDGDLSHLGTFSSEKGEYAIKHDEGNNRTYDYFNADNVENMKQAKGNYKKMMEFENGQVSLIGIKATAEIKTTQKTIPQSWLINRLSSGGLWGIDTDSEEYIKEVEQEQLEELKEVLKSFGFTEKQILKAEVIYEEI